MIFSKHKDAAIPKALETQLSPAHRSFSAAIKKSTQMHPALTAPQLPAEILLEIFGHLPRYNYSIWPKMETPPSRDWGLARICRAWHGPAMEYLCRSVYIDNRKEAEIFCNALLNQHLVRSLVRVLRLQWQSMRQSAPITHLYARIINLIESLETLHCPFGHVFCEKWTYWTGPSPISAH